LTDFKEDLAELRSRLATAGTLYQIDDLNHQRSSVASALAAVANFLEAQNFPPESLIPIMRPVLALAERENNNLDQMFAQRARGGRPKATIDDLERIGILAAFANAWLHIKKGDGRTQGSKLSEAARKMSGGWFGEVTRSSLKTARELVSQEAKDPPAVLIAALFNDFFEQSGVIFGEADAFQFMIDYVNASPSSHTNGILKTPPISPAEDG